LIQHHASLDRFLREKTALDAVIERSNEPLKIRRMANVSGHSFPAVGQTPRNSEMGE